MKRLILFGLAISLVLLITLPTLARSISTPIESASTDTYDLSWHVIAAGGATFSTGGDYSLGGTSGQYDAGEMSGQAGATTYALTGGFWNRSLAVYDVYLPLILRNG